MKITVLQHHPADNPGSIAEWAKDRHVELVIVDPKLKDFVSHTFADGLIILGGPMGVYEEEKYPWLIAEKQAIKNYLDGGKKTLGICLGAQLLANCLGARVYPHKFLEIGWFPVTKSNENSEPAFLKAFAPILNAFHWHGDTFDTPKEALPIFESLVCKNQGFMFKTNVLALQFHPEATPEWVRDICKSLDGQLKDQPFVQTVPAMIHECAKAEKIRPQFFGMLDRYFLER